VNTRDWVTRDLEAPYGPKIKCNFHTRVIIPADKTPSGQAYDFQPEEVKDEVMQIDQDYLLSLVYQQSACCGGLPGPAIHYFELV
jgi:hypothetical protein